MEINQINIATITELEECISTIVLGFSSDPVVRWIYPNPLDYLENFPLLVKAFGGKAFEQGTVYYTDQFLAVSIWLPPGVYPDEEEIVTLVEKSVPENRHKDVFPVFEQISQYHPEEPHWYLPFIGTDPNQQGRGYGSTLLNHTLFICDKDKKLAYLEATSERSARLFERHGFVVLGTIQQSTSPLIVPMQRSPQ